MDSDDLAIDELLGAAAARERTRHVDPEFVRQVERRLAEPRLSPLRAGVLVAAFAVACVLAFPQLAALWPMDLMSNLAVLAEPIKQVRSELSEAQSLWSELLVVARSHGDTSSWLLGAAFLLLLVPFWHSEV